MIDIKIHYKGILPPFTSPFVLIADRDNVVITQTTNDIPMITSD